MKNQCKLQLLSMLWLRNVFVFCNKLLTLHRQSYADNCK